MRVSAVQRATSVHLRATPRAGAAALAYTVHNSVIALVFRAAFFLARLLL
jgi:hypothetical protein